MLKLERSARPVSSYISILFPRLPSPSTPCHSSSSSSTSPTPFHTLLTTPRDRAYDAFPVALHVHLPPARVSCATALRAHALILALLHPAHRVGPTCTPRRPPTPSHAPLSLTGVDLVLAH